MTKTPPGQGLVLDQKMSPRLGCASQHPPVPVRLPFNFSAPTSQDSVEKEAEERPESACQQS